MRCCGNIHEEAAATASVLTVVARAMDREGAMEVGA
jgi:hypothetical protein